MAGPLHGLRIVEIASIGPGPFCAMVLSDLGAEVIRVDRAGERPLGAGDAMLRNRRSIVVDLKNPAGADVVLRLVRDADALLEGFRPGVAERLGIGPEACHRVNPGLVYGRVTGWGQEGPFANAAGHDIDYLALSGVLDAIGRPNDRPVPPLNVVADFGGGGMLLAVGVLAALLERDREDVVVDAAMFDGSALLATMAYGMLASGLRSSERGINLLDGGAPFYDTYRTADGGHVAVGALEPKFFEALVHGLGMNPEEFTQYDRSTWPDMRERFAAAFGSATRDRWEEVFRGIDACVTPVLTMSEAPHHPHAVFRESFMELGNMTVPAPAPRFRGRQATPVRLPPEPGADTDALLDELGYSAAEIIELRSVGAIA